MKKEYSLKGKKSFKEVYTKGKRYKEKGIVIFVLAIDSYTSTDKKLKFGISINKRIGKAHIRNHVKRQMRAICQDYISGIYRNFCIIIRPENDILNMSFTEAKKNLASLFVKAGVLKQ